MKTRPNRRDLLLGLATTAVAASLGEVAFAKPKPTLWVNGDRLRKTIEDLSVFGRPGETFAAGANRYAYSDADVAGRAWVMDMIRSFGATPRIDTAGNIFARLEGSKPGLKTMLSGSHIDTVPHGGNFDGVVGSLSAIEILRTMKEGGQSFRHPFEIAIWANEEGGTVGSQHAAGNIDPARLERMSNGTKVADGIRKIGGDPMRLAEAVIPKDKLHCYVELHIEQGGTMEKAGYPIGVVEGIVTTRSFEVEVNGFANHAGTTPMDMRQDALYAASKLVEAVREEVTREPGRQVGTVGKFDVFPNVGNIVPGQVTMNIGMRDLDGDKLERIGARIVERAKAIAAETNVEIKMTPRGQGGEAALATPAVMSTIEAAAKTVGLKTTRLPSGAGHDADPMSKLTQMGMIFIPSMKGISHSPKEFSRWEDITGGANVLLETLRRMDQA